MVLFFYGANDFMINQAVLSLKERYIKSSGGDLNITNLDGEDLDEKVLLGEIQAMPLLATSRLIIIKNIFRNKSKLVLDKIVEYIDIVPPSTVIIFTSNSPDKRLKLFKKLSSLKGSKEFELFDQRKIKDFIVQEIRRRDGKISSKAVDKLFDYVGDNLWQITNEIDKLCAYSNGKEIYPEDIEALVSKNIFSDVFAFVETLVGDNKAGMLSKLSDILSSGEPPLKLLGLIVYQFRSLAQVKEASEKTTNKFEIAKIVEASPYQVGKILGCAKRISWTEISNRYEALARIDEQIKTGKIEPGEGLKDLILSF